MANALACITGSFRLRSSAFACMVFAGLAVAPAASLADDVHNNPQFGSPNYQPSPDSLYLRHAILRPADAPNLLDINNTLDAAIAADPAARFILQLNGPMTDARRSALQALGVRLSTYLPVNAFIADLSRVPSASAALRALGFVPRVLLYADAWKLAPDLGRRELLTPARAAIRAQAITTVRITLFEGDQLQPALDRLLQSPRISVLATELAGDSWSIVADVPDAELPALTRVPGLMFAEDLEEFTKRDTLQRWVVQTNITNFTPLYTAGLTGRGQIIGIIDSWVQATHCAFNDPLYPIGPNHRKIVAYNSPLAFDIHGTHVAGIAVGDAGANDDNRGIAFNARMAFNTQPDRSESGYYDRFALHSSQGVRIHSNSYGNDATKQYDFACRAVDDFMWRNENELIVFAATNRADLRNPENAKNLLAVGATANPPGQNSLCSGGTGPTIDGRRRPEIWAPGCNVNGPFSGTSCSTTMLSGTSMATPAVSGVAALIRQYFTEGFYPTGAPRPADALTPSGALLKAMIINSGQDITFNADGYPGVREGWGRVLADASVFLAGDARKLIIRDVRRTDTAALSTAGSARSVVRVASGTQSFRVTLCFTDAPAAVNASLAPVNDLNLRVTSPSGVIYLGNVFYSGFSSPGGTPDALNSTEQVHLQSPQTGLWTIEVLAPAVNVGPQGFSLVLTGDVAHCIADFNASGTIDFFDYLDFITAFDADNDQADINRDGIVDFFDYLNYVSAYEQGC
jgi:subtilisin family serine protease